MQRELLIGIAIVFGFVALIIFVLGRSGKFQLDERPGQRKMPGKD